MSELRLKKEIFRLSDVEQTIGAFSDLCTVSIQEQEDIYCCLFCDCRYDIEETVKEFENYLIDLSYKTRNR